MSQALKRSPPTAVPSEFHEIAVEPCDKRHYTGMPLEPIPNDLLRWKNEASKSTGRAASKSKAVKSEDTVLAFDGVPKNPPTTVTKLEPEIARLSPLKSGEKENEIHNQLLRILASLKMSL